MFSRLDVDGLGASGGTSTTRPAHPHRDRAPKGACPSTTCASGTSPRSERNRSRAPSWSSTRPTTASRPRPSPKPRDGTIGLAGDGRDRVAVGVALRVAEVLGDARRQRLGDVVLQHLRLPVDLVPRHAELGGEVGLQQAVMADHLQRGLAAGLGELHALPRDLVDVADLSSFFSMLLADAVVTASASATAVVVTGPASRPTRRAGRWPSGSPGRPGWAYPRSGRSLPGRGADRTGVRRQAAPAGAPPHVPDGPHD